MSDNILALKNHIITLCNDSNFIHREWYVKYHLEIVEKISNELLLKYPSANKDLVLALVWFHDYGKIKNPANQYQETQNNGEKVLLDLGFNSEFVDLILKSIKILDSKQNLSSASIEIQIVSSADGASHLVGPFFKLWWKENSEKSIEELINENLRKSKVDWGKKIVLPEVKEKFLQKYIFFQEQCGIFPDSFL